METRFTRLVGCATPIQLAPMPGVSTVALAAAVAGAGGVGMVGTPLLSRDALEALLAELHAATEGVVGAGFLVPFLDAACVELAARRTRIVDFFFGEPDAALVKAVHAGGALASWQVGSLPEALRAVRCGCDFLVVQGSEAGGHVRGRSSLLPLLSQVVPAVDVPVLAAGGIATPRDLAAVLACGADGARLGTRFVAAAESGAHPAYVAALLAATGEDTCLTEAFSVLWPDAPHRVLRSAVRAAEALDADPVGELVYGGRTLALSRFSVFAPTRETTGHVEAMALYAGESVGNVDRVRPAGEIVAELVAGAERILAGLAHAPAHPAA